jgi:hypothetical protein
MLKLSNIFPPPQIAQPEKDDQTVQQFLEAECERLEQHIRVRTLDFTFYK